MLSYLSKLFLKKLFIAFSEFIETHTSDANNRLTTMYEKTTRIFDIFVPRTNAGATPGFLLRWHPLLQLFFKLFYTVFIVFICVLLQIVVCLWSSRCQLKCCKSQACMLNANGFKTRENRLEKQFYAAQKRTVQYSSIRSE